MHTALPTSTSHGPACRCDLRSASSNPARQLSSHRTSQGRVVYFRCDCGAVHMNIVRWAPH